MNQIFLLLLALVFAQLFPPVAQAKTNRDTRIMEKQSAKNPYYSRTDTLKLNVPDSVWKQVLSPALYAVARHKETEQAFTGKFWEFSGHGTYYCAACGNALFRSDAKFASTCGWPSFFEPVRAGSVLYKPDNSWNMVRTEVLCARCGAHLGHRFDDGPPPTRKRFCMNSISLDFEPDKPAPNSGTEGSVGR